MLRAASGELLILSDFQDCAKGKLSKDTAPAAAASAGSCDDSSGTGHKGSLTAHEVPLLLQP